MLENYFRRVVRDMKDNTRDAGKGLKKLLDSTLDNFPDLSEEIRPRPEPAPKAPDPERKLLLELFREFPQLAAGEDVSGKEKIRLLVMAREAYRRNDAALARLQAGDDFINALHSNMTRDYGMLGIMSNLLKASKNAEIVRWETYCGYAGKQMEELALLEQRAGAPVSGSFPEAMNAQALTDRIRHQMILLRRQPARTGYLPVYEQLKTLSFSGTEKDLCRWYNQAMAVMTRGLEALDPCLRRAIEEDYPVFSVSLCDGMTAPDVSGSIDPSEQERKDEKNGQHDS